MQNNNASTPSSSRPLASRLPSQLHTPTHSFSEAAVTPDSSMDSQLPNWNDKKSREELDAARSRLVDQKFNIKDYDDPLLPRRYPQSYYYPAGVTAETEAHLLKVIAEAKGSST
ncbi:hypothetical protein GGS26DRAFT_593875 [Hypomontagnella submonticulosa]|nr:hypothetical protein GGS26DRAFT_593875 [Hypomontagnella submonticulosa]